MFLDAYSSAEVQSSPRAAAPGGTLPGGRGRGGHAVKQGKGGPLLITETDEGWTNQSGEMVREARLTVVRY